MLDEVWSAFVRCYDHFTVLLVCVMGDEPGFSSMLLVSLAHYYTQVYARLGLSFTPYVTLNILVNLTALTYVVSVPVDVQISSFAVYFATLDRVDGFTNLSLSFACLLYRSERRPIKVACCRPHGYKPSD